MDNSIQIEVGDTIINFGQVHDVFEITEEVIYYKPHFESESSGGLKCSIPLKSLSESNIRKSLSCEDCKKYCKDLKKVININIYPDANEMTTLYKTNLPENLVRVIALLNQERKEKEHGLSTSKKMIFDKAVASFIQEFAFATDMTLEEAESSILNALS